MEIRYIAHVPLRPYIATLPERVYLSSELDERAQKLSEMRIEVTDLQGRKSETREERTAPEIAAGMRKKGIREEWIVCGTLGSGQKDLSRLPEPIHRAFANWNSTPADIISFTKRYGLLWDCVGGGEHLVSGAWIRSDFEFPTKDWVELQSSLRNWWRYQFGPVPEEADPKRKALQEAVRKVKEERRRGKGILDPLPMDTYYEQAVSLAKEVWLDVSKGRKGRLVAELVAPDLWHYMTVLLLSEKHEMLRVCEREDCETPYYFAARRDQKYCGTDCSQLVATRKWWAAHGQEWRRKRKESKKGKKKARR